MRKLTHVEFCDKVNRFSKDKFLFLSEYTGERNKIYTRCLICLHEWYANPKPLKNGVGCPECGKIIAAKTVKWKITQDDFLKRIPPEILKNTTILGNYKSVNSQISVKCKKCNYQWNSRPRFLYVGYGCTRCGHDKTGVACQITHNEFVARVNKYHNDSIKILTQYAGGDKKIKAKCLECHYIWKRKARTFLSRGCPVCRGSKGEKKLHRLFEDMGLNFRKEVTTGLRGCRGGNLKFDFAVYMNGKTIYIEYDGGHHFKPIKRWGGLNRLIIQQKNDLIKNEYCKSNSIPLIRIKYYDYGKIDKNYLLKLLAESLMADYDAAQRSSSN